MTERLTKKIWRLKELERVLLEAHPRGLHNAKLAELIGISRSEIPEYLLDLKEVFGAEVYAVDPDDKLHAINPAMHRYTLRLNLDESLAVLLAVRLLTTRSDKQNPHAAGALRELAGAFDRPAPFLAQHIRQAAGILVSDQRRYEPVFLRALERLTRAWADRVKVKLDYESDAGHFSTHIFAPYFIEPYAVGSTLHVIGRADGGRSWLTLKVERIRNAELLAEAYTIPEGFNPDEILRDAWGIWRSDKAPVPVRLRFSRAVAYRVRETTWHYAEETQEDDQGRLLWHAPIAEPREMLPWLRGWGADCEVLEPGWLREELVREAQRLMTLYQPEQAPPPKPYHWLWAKIDRNRPAKAHRLLYHLLDVGHCALAVWETALPVPLKRQVADWLKVSEADAGRFCAFWAALHDLGKASPVFQWHTSLAQKQRGAIKAELEQVGFQFPKEVGDTHHAVITTWALRNESLLPDFEPGLVNNAAQAIGGHHGTWPLSTALLNISPENSGRDGRSWQEARAALVQELRAVFQPPVLTKFAWDIEAQNTFFAVLSGLVAVADWLGSDDKRFGYEDGVWATGKYAAQAQATAHEALSQHRWQAVPELRARLDFATLFPGKTPHKTQAAAIGAAAELPAPALVILEAPMGSGKTEAALSLYAKWARATERRGLYVAMPTMATSNQMHDRVEKFLHLTYGAEVAPLLIHSHAALKDALLDDTDQAGADKKEAGERAAALAWFLPRKQSLLFPFGVGTVDQAFLGVLQTKHFFVRLLGLSHKVVIFDEVHAYDTYMNTLFKRLLVWLRQVGASVIILSATLPEKTRRELAQAYAPTVTVPPAPAYPRLTWAADGKAESVPLPGSNKPRWLGLEWLARDTAAIIRRLRAELAQGGCAAVICNTVGRAQQLYLALVADNRQEPWVNEEDLMLFHARYPFAWRNAKEKAVLAKFGPPDQSGNSLPTRPKKAVLIATQVIEQSLDLDFDLMLSDFAPTDLLLQRAGRLHRHERKDRPPLPDQLIILALEPKDDVPQFDRADKFIYEHYVLLRSWLTLKGYGATITLPEDLSEVIEQTYDEAREFAEVGEVMKAKLKEALGKQKEKQREKRHKAEGRLIAQADDSDLLLSANEKLEDEDPLVAETFQALTRADGPGVSLVCVHRTDNGDALDPQDASTRSTHFFQPDKDVAVQLALHAVTVQNHDVIKYFSANEHLPEAWKKIAALRYSRLAIFNKHGFCILDGQPYTLRLTRELGLEIIPANQAVFVDE